MIIHTTNMCINNIYYFDSSGVGGGGKVGVRAQSLLGGAAQRQVHSSKNAAIKFKTIDADDWMNGRGPNAIL